MLFMWMFNKQLIRTMSPVFNFLRRIILGCLSKCPFLTPFGLLALKRDYYPELQLLYCDFKAKSKQRKDGRFKRWKEPAPLKVSLRSRTNPAPTNTWTSLRRAKQSLLKSLLMWSVWLASNVFQCDTSTLLHHLLHFQTCSLYLLYFSDGNDFIIQTVF